ncbi:hypothetical protein ONZ45_g18338 [Pleurotus djamor]|nr:hypothetical protein ONZ45_g18338 [Pleurotus djamor]
MVSPTYDLERLPDDILALIFLSCCEDDTGAMHLQGVCKRWRAICLSTHRMWAFINLAHIDRVPMMLERAKAAPLVVKMPLLLIPCEQEETWATVKHVLSLSRQFRTLSVTSGHTKLVTKLFGEIKDDAPILEEILLSGGSTARLHAQWDDDRWHWTHLPSLRTLELCDLPLPRHFPTTPRLTRLVISYAMSEDLGTLTIWTVLSILRNTLLIEEISVGMICPVEYALSSPDPISFPEKLVLDHLKHIDVSAQTFGQLSLFNYIEFPTTTEVCFTSHLDNLFPPSDEASSVATLEHVCSRLYEGLGEQGLEATFVLQPNFPSSKFFPIDPSTTPVFEVTSRKRCHFILPAIRRLTPAVKKLTLVMLQNAPDFQFIEQLLPSLPNVETIVLEYSHLSLLELLEPRTSTSTPTVSSPISSSPAPVLILPKLREVIVTGGAISEDDHTSRAFTWITRLLNSRPSVIVRIYKANAAIEIKDLICNEPRVLVEKVNYFGDDGIIYDW